MLIVYVDDPEIGCLNDEKLPIHTHRKVVSSNKVQVSQNSFQILESTRIVYVLLFTSCTSLSQRVWESTLNENVLDSSNWILKENTDRVGIFTVVEEDSESDRPIKKPGDLSRMPDLVKDTVRTVEKKLGRKKHICKLQVESFIVDTFVTSSSCSYENICNLQSEPIR